MEPLCLLACRRSHFLQRFMLFVLASMLVMCLSVHNVLASTTYDRQFLLGLQSSSIDSICMGYDEHRHGSSNPPFLARIPSIICRVPGCFLHRKRRLRRWGKCSGNLVRLRRAFRYRRELLDYASVTLSAYAPLNGFYNYGLRLSYLPLSGLGIWTWQTDWYMIGPS